MAATSSRSSSSTRRGPAPAPTPSASGPRSRGRPSGTAGRPRASASPPSRTTARRRTISLWPRTGRCTMPNDSAGTGFRDEPGTMLDRTQLLEGLIDIGLALTSERDLHALLERILELARRFTRAEAGTLFLREGDHLRFAVVQNDFLEARLGKSEMQRRLQAAPMALSEPSLAGHVAQTGEIINVRDAYAIGGQRRVAFNKTVEETNDYATRSVFAVPLQDRNGSIVGVLELLNALGEDGATVPFDPEYEKLIRALASQAAIAIRNARLED